MLYDKKLPSLKDKIEAEAKVVKTPKPKVGKKSNKKSKRK